MSRILPLILALLLTPTLRAQQPTPLNPKQLVQTMVANENEAAQHRGHFAYTSNERSDRTNGHLWTERVVETSSGKVRFLLAEDGQPLSPEREAAERGRLAAIVADPAAFAKPEQATADDDAHAKQMLSILSRAYLLGTPQPDAGELCIPLTPDPAFQPQSIEERILHAMSGTLWIDAHSLRLHRLEGKLPEDLNIGFGILATIKDGSSFATARDPEEGEEWKTTLIDTNVNGRAIFFKTIARKQHTARTDFRRVPDNISIPQAVALAEQ